MRTNIVFLIVVSILLLILFLMNKEDKEMAVVYATLIIKGKRVFSSIPKTIKQQVADVLIDMELEELIDEDEYKPTKIAD